MTKAYGRGEGRVAALRGVDLSVRPGRFVAIMGPSGSGKTTLLQCVSGLETPTSGYVELLGTNISKLSRTRRTRLRRWYTAFVFQNYTLLPTLNVWQNITVPFVLAGRPVPTRRIDTILHRLGMAERRNVLPATLSGGERQRVALARALAIDAAIIFADEPTGALDVETGRAVLELLRSHVTPERAVLMVTHDAAAASRADEVVFLVDGRVSYRLAEPTPEEVNAVLVWKTSVQP